MKNMTSTTNESGEENIFHGNAHKEKKRKRNNKHNWKKIVTKEKRMKGENYIGYRRTKENKIFHDSPREERKMGPRCNSKFCEKSAVRTCNEITEAQRKILFDKYWQSMNWDQRKVYVGNMVQKCNTKRKTLTKSQGGVKL